MSVGALQVNPQFLPSPSLCELPPELILEIMSQLPRQSVLASGATCKLLRALSQTNTLCLKMLKERFPDALLKQDQGCYAAYVAACRRHFYDTNIDNGICVRTRALQSLVTKHSNLHSPHHALAANTNSIFRSRECYIDYLDAYGSTIEVLQGHTDKVSALAADDHTLVSTSIIDENYSEMRIWQLDNHTVLAAKIQGCATALALRDGECFIGCGNTILVLNLEQGNILQWHLPAPSELPIIFLALDEERCIYAREKSVLRQQVHMQIHNRFTVDHLGRLGCDTDMACPGFALDDGRLFSQHFQDGSSVISHYNLPVPMPDFSETLPGPGGSFPKVHRVATCGPRFINSFAGTGVAVSSSRGYDALRETPGWMHDAIEIRDYSFSLTYVFQHLAAQMRNGVDPSRVEMAMDTFKEMKGVAATAIKNRIFGRLYDIQKREGVLEQDHARCEAFAFFNQNGLHSTLEHRAEAILQEVGAQGIEAHDELVLNNFIQNAWTKQILDNELLGYDPWQRYSTGKKWKAPPSRLSLKGSACHLL